MSEVKVGQIWEDWDSRFRDHPRQIKVLSIEGNKAVVQDPRGRGIKTKIRLDRFKPTSTGYRLLRDAP